MTRKKGLIAKVLMWVIGLFITLAVAGLFVNGQTLNAPIISIFPLWIHQIIGWLIVLGVIIGAIIDFMK